MAKDFLKQAGSKAEAWREHNIRDPIALTHSRNGFSLWLGNVLSPVYHHRIGYKFQTVNLGATVGIWRYTDDTFVLLRNSVSMPLSLFLTVLTIFVLFYLENMRARLTAVMAFSVMFSAVMTFFAQGRRYGIFAATAAFATVQVVIVGEISVTDRM